MHGRLVTDAAEIDAALREHWSRVFSNPPLPPDGLSRLDAWLEVLGDSCRVPGPAPPLLADAIHMAVKHAGSSAPGPDGIPCEYRFYDGLCDALQFLRASPDPSILPEGFDHSRLICLPKKPAGHDPGLGENYTPENTRPLSVVSTDNRLMAAAVKIALRDYLEAWISEAQQGFLNGRSTLSNTFLMNTHSKLYSLQHPPQRFGVFDLKAAFPSVDHEFMSFCGVSASPRLGSGSSSYSTTTTSR